MAYFQGVRRLRTRQKWK